MFSSGTPSSIGRIGFAAGAVTLWTVLILARLVQLQVIQHKEYVQLALQRQQITRSVLAPRGVIYDSHMDELATSVSVSTVAAEPRRIKDVRRAARSLASILHINPADLHRRMTDPARQTFLIVKRRIEPKAEALVESLGIDGVYLMEESMRVYPNRNLGSHVLGFVNMNGDGSAGVELQYDGMLKGRQGQLSFDVDARRRSFRGTVVKPPVQGHALVLSIDKSIQYIAEQAITAGVEKYRAASGTAIVMEADTGRILAMANYPDFNCNKYNEYEQDLLRNRAVSDLFEPGSTFKVVVAGAALEAGLTRKDEVIDCQMGSITIGRHIFHDHKPYGLLTFAAILEQSSNVGAAKLGLRLGEQGLYEALRTFGFGSKTRIDLPGEIVGLVRDWHKWSSLSIGAISFGQEVGVTSIQILTAINAIANGGYRVRPSVVDYVIDANGDRVQARVPERTRILRPETAAAVREAFEGVVAHGTGKKAQLEGYRAAGKTGTAQKIVDGRYSNSKYLASFIGFAPLPNPRISVLVSIDEPKGAIYGGEVSAPIFQKITQQSLMQLRVAPDNSLPTPSFNPSLAQAETGDFLPNATPVVPVEAAPEPPVDTPAKSDAPESVIVRVTPEAVTLPDFRGMAKRAVVERCFELGIRLQASGSGIAIEQKPPAGSPVGAGLTCSVVFARRAAATVREPNPPVQSAQADGQSATTRP